MVGPGPGPPSLSSFLLISSLLSDISAQAGFLGRVPGSPEALSLRGRRSSASGERMGLVGFPFTRGQGVVIHCSWHSKDNAIPPPPPPPPQTADKDRLLPLK